MIYSKVEYVGCADIIFLSSVHLGEHISEGFLKRFVCNYGPAYSLDEPLYEEGPPCSKCKYGSSQRYENLCASKFSIFSRLHTSSISIRIIPISYLGLLNEIFKVLDNNMPLISYTTIISKSALQASYESLDSPEIRLVGSVSIPWVSIEVYDAFNCSPGAIKIKKQLITMRLRLCKCILYVYLNKVFRREHCKVDVFLQDSLKLFDLIWRPLNFAICELQATLNGSIDPPLRSIDLSNTMRRTIISIQKDLRKSWKNYMWVFRLFDISNRKVWKGPYYFEVLLL